MSRLMSRLVRSTVSGWMRWTGWAPVPVCASHLHVCGEDGLSGPGECFPAAGREQPPSPWRSSHSGCEVNERWDTFIESSICGDRTVRRSCGTDTGKDLSINQCSRMTPAEQRRAAAMNKAFILLCSFSAACTAHTLRGLCSVHHSAEQMTRVLANFQKYRQGKINSAHMTLSGRLWSCQRMT